MHTRLNKTQRELLICAFKHGHALVTHDMLSLTNRRGLARKKLEALGLLVIEKQWITNTGGYHTINRLTDAGHRRVLSMLYKEVLANTINPWVIETLTEYTRENKENGKKQRH